MPELPEMEVYRHLLTEKLLHKPILNVEIRRERSINLPTHEFQARITHRRIQSLQRRAKHLLFRLDSGDALLLHLMLGGWMYYGDLQDTPRHSSQVVLTFADGHQLFFQGLRLGYLHLYTDPEVEAKLQQLGPEPLGPSFTLQVFQQALSGKRAAIKFVLVDQHSLAGVGNCYSDETCFHAGILPLRSVSTLQSDEITRLHDSLRTVLTRAISLGGYMEFPSYRGDTLTGGYNDHCLVYDRGSAPCLRCGNPITKTMHQQRKVFYCANCQR